MTLLTVITPTYRRPIGLAFNQATIAAQHQAARIEHLIMVDEVGAGIPAMYRRLREIHPSGEWVFLLPDDDCLIHPDICDVIDQCAFTGADVIMVGAYVNGASLPWSQCWQAPPQMGGVTITNWIVRRAVFESIPYGERYEGDFDFITEVWRRGLSIAWAAIILTAQQRGANFGRPE